MLSDVFSGIPGVKLHKAAFGMAKRAERELVGRTELTFHQFMMLVMVKHKEHCKQTEMAQMGHLTEAAVSRMVVGMAEKGLVTRRENPRNRREHMVTLTEKGKKSLNKGMEVVKESLGEVLGKLTTEEREKLDGLLDKILRFVYTETERYA
jgi:MarR family transcriptional regulator for hemolysin